MASEQTKYTISPSISAVVQVFGEHANNYKIYRTKSQQPPQSLLSYLSSDFTGCYLKVSMKDPTLIGLISDKKQTLHIPIDSSSNFWLAFNRVSGDSSQGYEIKLPISVLGHHFITLLENTSNVKNLAEYFANPSDLKLDVFLDVPVADMPECYKPHQLRVAKFPETDPNNPTPKPHTLQPTTWQPLTEECRASICYQLVINLQKQKLKHQIEQINTLPAHNLYPAMNERHKRRAILMDCRCLKFGCQFVGATPEDLKQHLKNSPCSDYVDFYAANHQRLAKDSLQIINDQLFKNTFPALCRKTSRVIQGIKGSETHKTFTCNSPLCEYTTHTVENILEHFRLLGCQFAPIIRKYYGSDHPMPTEEDNRKWHVSNLVDNLNGELTVSENTSRIILEKSAELYRFDIVPYTYDKFIEWYGELISNLALGGTCINCGINRQNVVSLGCCHLSVCSKCLGSFQSPKCAECFLPLDEYLIITGI